MAAASGTTYDIGSWPLNSAPQHEDLMDQVTIIDSYQTPMFSSMPKVRATDVIHSWAIDSLDPTATGGTSEGVDFLASSMSTPTRMWNVTQIFSVGVQVSDRERAVNPAGIRDFYEHQVMKGFKVIARDVESRFWTVTANSTTATGITANTAPRMAGFQGNFGPGAGPQIFISGSGSAGVTTADIIALARNMFLNGAEPDSLWFSPISKQQFFLQTTSSNVNTRNIAAIDDRMSYNVDVFESPFGQLFAVITDRFIPISTNSASGCAYYMGDRSMAKLAVLRPPQHKPMGKGGDHTRGLCLMECTLQLDHPSAWGAITGVTG